MPRQRSIKHNHKFATTFHWCVAHHLKQNVPHFIETAHHTNWFLNQI